MAGITYVRFQMDISSTIMFLVMIIGFSIFKIVKLDTEYDEYVILAGLSFFTIVSLRRFEHIATKMLSDKSIRLTANEHIFYEYAIIMTLGSVSCYIFFYKGLYGLYQLFSSFSWYLLFFRIFIIIVAGSFAKSISNLIDVFNWLKHDTWQDSDKFNRRYKED